MENEYMEPGQEMTANGREAVEGGQEPMESGREAAGSGQERTENGAGGGTRNQPPVPMGAMPRYKILNREAVKYIAVAAMTFNHISHAGFLPYGSPLYELFVDIGYITAVTMCFFLVEGYHYTRSMAKYVLRLFAFALLSQAPFRLAFGDIGLNMIYTLWLCFLILLVMDKVRPLLLRIPLVLVLTALSVIGDWPLIAPIATVLFELSREERNRQLLAYAVAALLLGRMEYYIFIRQYVPAEAALHTLYAVLPVGVSAVLTLGLYNGKQAEGHRAFHRWFFYVYYPAHLLALWAIRRTMWGW